MKNVIVPVDFSPTSAVAVKFGAHMANSMNHMLRVVHVSGLDSSLMGELSISQSDEGTGKLKKRLEKFTREKIGDREATGPAVSVSVIAGNAARVLLDLSREAATSLVVMGGVGAGAKESTPGLYGEVATSVALQGDCPVILMPKGRERWEVEKMIVAVDDADEVIRIGQSSRAIAKALQPRIRYVHVGEIEWGEQLQDPGSFVDRVWGDAISSRRFGFDLLPSGDVSRQLCKYARKEGADLLVLGSKRLGFWQRLRRKGNLKPILQSVGVPVLVIPCEAGQVAG